MRPKVKIEHRPVRYGTDLVHLGGMAAVADPAGWVWALLELLDGTRTVGEVAAELARQFPDRPASAVRAAISELWARGHLLDADAPAPPELSVGEVERYKAGVSFADWADNRPRASRWATQLLLKQARVAVIGVGGVGSMAAWALAVSGVGHLHCVDHDVVELSNLNRQALYTESDLGRPKVEVIVERLRARNSDIEVSGEFRRVDGPAAVRALAVRSDVLLLAADTPGEIAGWVDRVCAETGTAWVRGGYHGPQLSIGVFRPGAGPCHNCLHAEQDARQAAAAETPWSPGVGIPAPHSANAISTGITGLMAAEAVQALITGVPAIRTNCHYGHNLLGGWDVRGLDAPSPHCPNRHPRP
ncbi:ThiF family adenylyltransferase [Actinokineospora diospyrosa]|uniref:Molybdopterin or thiamine biosynthesis adenylyltransferase n=1 Tax=Actinokineospora diospyrosa TaxID=103728 RepID=A0ABT1IBN1_9PSEU|nr:ThiF family adenylyltransferase [Actinokineospora diospyrosa]MCP2270042.1 Molybdopterin or thiamine biosynthesis adenylyltransferase [Actinokineospora diospyrosa]